MEIAEWPEDENEDEDNNDRATEQIIPVDAEDLSSDPNFAVE